MRKLILVFLLAGSWCARSSAQTALLPDRFGSWEATGPSKTTSGARVYEGRPDAEDGRLREAGLLSLEQRTYKNGTDELQLNVYKVKDTSGAYELYSQAIAPDMASANIGDESAFRSTDGVILIGNLVVATGPLGHGLKTASLAELVPALKAKADPTPYPPLRTYLPMKWRVFGTEKYAQGPVGFGYAMDTLGQGAYRNLGKEAGFDSGAEAILAKYQGQHGSGTLLLLQYPTPQIAENHLHHLEQALPASAKQSGVTVERKASLLSLVFAATAPQHAQAIRDEVNYETEVTWNEPSTTATDPPLVYVMFKIFVFTSLFLVFATVIGIFFGGLRILIKHWLPGKVFDRPQDIEVLQLGLSGKKIDPTDMY
jgi:hypothetical protein